MVLLVLFASGSAFATERLCDPAFEYCRQALVNRVQDERIGIDVAFWFMDDKAFSDALIERHRAGVRVRILFDERGFAARPGARDRVLELAAAGIPMRKRTATGILHWKAMVFAGQNDLEFSGANYTAGAFRPLTPYQDYEDEVIYFTDDPSLVNSFKRKYDDLWTDTTTFANYANVGPLTREYPKYSIDADLNFVPAEDYGARAVKRYDAEMVKVDVIIFRITDRRHSDAMIDAVNRGVTVRLITEPDQYRDPVRYWHSWNVDRMWTAGVQIRNRGHAGVMHQKSVVLYGQTMSIFGSSNWTGPSSKKQEEHNYFTTKTWIFQWLVDQFERKWNNLTGHQETTAFTPLPPGKPQNKSPSNGATGVSTGPTLAWYAGLWAHTYDVYLGTSSSSLKRVATNLELGPSKTSSDLKRFTPSGLKSGTIYYWQIVSKTMANRTAAGSVWSFKTK